MSLGLFSYLSQVVFQLVFEKPRWKEWFYETYVVANQSAPVIIFCVVFAAIVTVVEAAFHMRMVIHDTSMVPGFAALFILRELGVVIACLLVVSRVGAGYASQVAIMHITEQIEALKMLGINPIKYIVVPRLVACVLGCVVLSVLANSACLIGATLVSSNEMGISNGEFISAMRRFVGGKDIFFSMIKASVFGAIIPLTACFLGFRSQGGAEGVGQTTTQSVVASSVLIIVADFVLCFAFSPFYD